MRASVSQGGTTVTYTDSDVLGVPRADIVTVDGPDPAGVVMSRLPGWLVNCGEELGAALLAAGAAPVRHAHRMERDLRTAPPPPLSTLRAAPGLRFAPCDRTARELFPAWNAAYAPGHPDRPEGSDEEIIAGHLTRILDGTRLGPVLPVSTLLVDDTDRIRAAVIVVAHHTIAWVIQLFRTPGQDLAGAGQLLLQQASAQLDELGHARVGLAVSTTNPAKALYERVGFEITDTSRTLRIPG